jgi:hypothetical protein
VPEFGMYPYMPHNENLYFIAEVKGLRCRPCSKIGFKQCPEKHFKCMNNQDVDKMYMINTSNGWKSSHN